MPVLVSAGSKNKITSGGSSFLCKISFDSLEVPCSLGLRWIAEESSMLFAVFRVAAEVEYP